MKDKVDRYTNYDLDIEVTLQFTSNKELMWSKVVDNEESETTSIMNTRINILLPRALAFSKVLQILVSYQLKVSYQMKIVTKLMKI